nr:zinc finger, CCHC-type [Tanacetum cinerariifolium]
MVNDDVDMIAMVSDVCAMISKVNLVGTNHGGWWIDTEATRQVCADKSMFHSFRAVDNGHKLYRVNSATTDIKGKGDGGNKYFITFIDDCTKYCYVYLLKSKDEAMDKFVLDKTKVENQLGKKIKKDCKKNTTTVTPGQVDKKPAKVAMPTLKAQKIRPKSVDYIFIGYAKNNSAYRFIVHESKNPDIQKNTVMESRNASFFENVFPCLSKETGSSSRLDDEIIQDKRQRDDNDLQDERQDQTEEEEVEPTRSKNARNEKSFGPDFVSFMVENEPTSYQDAVTSSEGHQ